MLQRNMLATCVGIVCLGLSVCSVQAQESASIQALANVISAITVTGTNDLNFGSITPGTPVSIDKGTVGSAGEFTITGPLAAEVSLDFELPDSLRAAGGEAMDIVFTATDGSFDDGTGGGQVAPSGVISPLVSEVANIGPAGDMTVWIGGRVDPGVAQTGGAYAGTITLTVTLTGN